MSTTAPMEAPIAADAPVDRPFELEGEEDEGDEEVLVVEAEEVFVAELGSTLEAGVAVAGGVFADRWQWTT